MITNRGIIVDANCFGENLRKDVRDAVEDKKVRIIIPTDGKLRMEVRRANIEIFREYSRNRFFHFICRKQVESTIQRLRRVKCSSCKISQCGCIRSDDEHIIAAAIVSRANVIVSNDEKLMSDFENCKEIDLKYGGTNSTDMPDCGQRRIITFEKCDRKSVRSRRSAHRKVGTPVKATQEILNVATFSERKVPCNGNPKLCQECPF